MLTRSVRKKPTKRVVAITLIAETAGEEIFFGDLESHVRSSVDTIVITVKAGISVSRLTLETRKDG